MRYHAHYRKSGEGHIYQGRFKSFHVQDDNHFRVVCRYVERNALRAGLVDHAEDWRWGPLWRWTQKIDPDPKLLSPWPMARLPDRIERVNEPLGERELEAVRRCVRRSSPLGEESWTKSTARRLGLESTLRPRSRPRVRPAHRSSVKKAGLFNQLKSIRMRPCISILIDRVWHPLAGWRRRGRWPKN